MKKNEKRQATAGGKRKSVQSGSIAKGPGVQTVEVIDILPPPDQKGRPTDYTPDIGERICALLAEGNTLTSICKPSRLPSERTVRTWAADPNHPFSPHYARAREVGYHKMFDQMLDISDDATNDFRKRTNEEGETIEAVDHDHIARSRLRIDTRKWMLAKALPKIYGDKVEIDTPPDGGIAKAVAVSSMAIAAIIQRGKGE